MSHHTLRSASCPIHWLNADSRLEKQRLAIAHPDNPNLQEASQKRRGDVALLKIRIVEDAPRIPPSPHYS